MPLVTAVTERVEPGFAAGSAAPPARVVQEIAAAADSVSCTQLVLASSAATVGQHRGSLPLIFTPMFPVPFPFLTFNHLPLLSLLTPI